MDNIGNYKKVIDIGWNALFLRMMYVVDTFEYLAVDTNTGDIYERGKSPDDVEDAVYHNYGDGAGAV